MGRDRMLAGEFGAAARLSPKALRLYAEQGLLVPAGADPATGYRHYSPQQLPRARLIGRLRSLGLPLARIATLVELTPDARAIELRGWVRGQQRLLTERAALVDTIERYADSTALSATVVVRDVAATKVLCRSREISVAELPDMVAVASRDIRAHLRTAGLPGDAPLRVQFQGLVSHDSEGTVEVAIPFDGHVEPVRDLFIRLAPAHRAAVIAVPPDHEDYPLILRVYDAIEEWASGAAVGSSTGPVGGSAIGSSTGSPAGSEAGSAAGSSTGSPAGSSTGSAAGSPAGCAAGSPAGSAAGSVSGWTAGSAGGAPAGSAAIAGMPYELHPGATGARFDVVYPIEEE